MANRCISHSVIKSKIKYHEIGGFLLRARGLLHLTRKLKLFEPSYLMQFSGSPSQSVLQRNRSHESHPIGGVRARPFSKLVIPVGIRNRATTNDTITVWKMQMICRGLLLLFVLLLLLLLLGCPDVLRDRVPPLAWPSVIVSMSVEEKNRIER